MTVLLGACDASVASGLDEPQANAIVEALARAGISAQKRRGAGADDTTHEVRVAADALPSALAVLRDEALPRRDPPGLGDVFGRAALVPTPTEERARLAAALSGELATTLQHLDAVREARVHVALPATTDLRLEPTAERPRPEASVLLEVVEDVPAPSDDDLRRIVAGAVDGMEPADVAIVRVVAPTRSPDRQASQLASVGPFRVAPASAPGLQALLAGLFATLGVLAITLVALVRRHHARVATLRAALVAAEDAVAVPHTPREAP